MDGGIESNRHTKIVTFFKARSIDKKKDFFMGEGGRAKQGGWGLSC